MNLKQGEWVVGRRKGGGCMWEKVPHPRKMEGEKRVRREE